MKQSKSFNSGKLLAPGKFTSFSLSIFRDVELLAACGGRRVFFLDNLDFQRIRSLIFSSFQGCKYCEMEGVLAPLMMNGLYTAGMC